MTKPPTVVAKLAAILAITLITGTANAEEQSLCPVDGKVLYEADAADGSFRVAVCSEPDTSDSIGTISIYSGTKAADGFTSTLLLQAQGKTREKAFVIRRYTRPQTTYLKFEFTAQDGRRYTIYDDFDNGQASTRVAWKKPSEGAGAEPADFVSVAAPLMLMSLEAVVSVQPYDE